MSRAFAVLLEHGLCKGQACALCQHTCPQDVFEPAVRPTPQGIIPMIAARPGDCIGCGRCEQFCPELAIDILPADTAPAVPTPAPAAGIEASSPSGGWASASAALSPGNYFFSGNEASAEGALAAGCRFFAGYPITPSSEAMLHLSRRLPQVDGTFIQMEDEIASMAAVIGACWAGCKAMTATSGPGISLMLENIGYAVMTETPCVILNAQRAGPSTGQASRPAQGDVMQSRWGPHGGPETIALAPWSVQEMYDLTIRAFNLSERFRIPVAILADEIIAHLLETVTIEPEVRLFHRHRRPTDRPFGSDSPAGVPPMPALGEGARLLVTGSTHDERGFRRTTDAMIQGRLTNRLAHKILDHQQEIDDWETYQAGDAGRLLIAYGSVARSTLWAVLEARRQGMRAGLLRLKSLWPFPDEIVRQMCGDREEIIVPEMNLGQVSREVGRCAGAAVTSLTQSDGELIDPRRILRYLMERTW